MWHEFVSSERHTFPSLVEVLKGKDLVRFFRQLQSAGIKSAYDLESWPRGELRHILGDVALDSLLAPPARPSKKSRQDIPEVKPRTRGSLQRLGLEPGPSGLVEPVSLDVNEADRQFLRDRWASSSQAPRESRRLTWTRLSAKRGLPNLPITRESLFAVGALLKAGGYRSSAQYVSVAKQKHREAGFTWGPELDEARAQCLRSINRGLGPATPKLDLRIENADDRFASLLQQAYLELKVSFEDRLQFAAQACITACWFMLRGIELANVQARDVVFNRQARTVKLQLPVSKTDTEAKGCYRVHKCICDPRHEAGCSNTTPPELFGTAFQKCSCKSGLHVLCVYHALLQVVVQLRKQQLWTPTTHVFAPRSGGIASKFQVIMLARACAFILQQEQLDAWGPEAINRWSQHVFRVAGAQMFARALLDVPYIQLLGRWGSSAVLRYVQEAAVLLPEKAASAVAAHVSPNEPPVAASGSRPCLSIEQPSLQDSIKLAVEKALQGTQLLVHNPRSKMCHRPSPSEQQLPSDRWVTFCGKWWYGTSCTRRNTSVLKGFTKCSLCFSSGALSASPATDSQARDVESGTELCQTSMTWPPGPASTKRW